MEKKELGEKITKFRNLLYELQDEEIEIEKDAIVQALKQIQTLLSTVETITTSLVEKIDNAINDALTGLAEPCSIVIEGQPIPRSFDVRLREGMRMLDTENKAE